MGKKQIGSAGPPYEFNPETKFSIIDLKNTLNNLIELEKTIESDEIKYNINYKTNLDSSEKQSEY
ncbi:hypothetical protein EBV26_20615, partial [bacterium]|nr:hypothetical protein [bacterium]